jgi:hypothetical protein
VVIDGSSQRRSGGCEPMVLRGSGYRNGCGVKRPSCGVFYRPGEAGRKRVHGERRSALSEHHSRLRFYPRRW